MNPIILVLMAASASTTLEKQSTDSYCNTQSGKPTWAIAFDYRDSPVVLEAEVIERHMIDTMLITLHDKSLNFTEQIVSSSSTPKKRHQYSIAIDDDSLSKLLKDQDTLILHNKDGHLSWVIPTDFIRCMKDQLGR